MKRRLSLLVLAVVASSGLTLGTSLTASGTVTSTVDGIDPNSGSTAGGTQVAIFGSGFSGATRVNFGGTPIFKFFTADDHRIFVQSPPGAAGTIDVTVSAGGITSATSVGDRFTYKVMPPTVDAVDPRRGTAAGGTGVAILGQGLSGATEVHFGTVRIPCAPGPSGPSPAKANALKLERAMSDAAVQQRAGSNPTGPAAGPGGGPGSCLTFGDGSLFVNSPPGTAGSIVDVTVTTGAGISSPGAGTKFSYVAPTAPIVNAVGPDHGTANGGTNVTIFGSGLAGATKVNFGPSVVNACPVFSPATPTRSRVMRLSPVKTVRQPLVSPASAGGGGPGGPCFATNGSDSLILIVSPAGPIGLVDVTVTTPVATSATGAADKFTFDQPGPPQVDAVDPNHGTKFGTATVLLHGSGFTGATAVLFGLTSIPPCGQPPGPQVCFGVGGDQNIFLTTPAGPAHSTVDVRVTVGTGGGAVTSAIGPGDKFTWDAPTAPVINAIDPDHGPTGGGTNVTLFGSGFADPTVSMTVGGTAVPQCPPPGQGSACFSAGSDSNIFLTTPSNAATGPVTVIVNTAAGSGSTTFTYTAPSVPVVTGVSPGGGPNSGGTTVWISGSGLSGATHVAFDGSLANFFVPFGSDTLIQATSPPCPGCATVHVRVFTPGGPSVVNPNDQYAYTPSAPVKPTVTAVNPNGGPTGGGQTVYITGSGFASDPGTSSMTVEFGPGNLTGFNIVSDTLIQATTQMGAAGTVDVVVTNSAGPSATSPDDNYQYGGGPPPPPVVSGVTPNQGTRYGGTGVTIYGFGFGAATSLAFGGTSIPVCSPSSVGPCFFVMGDTQIFTFSPPGNPGTVDIVVTSQVGPSPMTKADKFTFVTPGPPTVNALDPKQGPTSGGTNLSIFGNNFSGATGVSIGGTPLPACSPSTFVPCFFIQGDNQITATTPGGPAGPADVIVTTPSGASATTNDDKFTYVVPAPPTVTKVSPNTGGTSGGTTVYITGTNLQGAGPVNFGPNSTFSFFPMTPNVLLGMSPPGSVGTIDVTVTTPGGTSPITPADRYTYTQSPAPTITAVSPSSGPSEGGTIVFITGTDLAPVNSLNFGTANTFNFFPLSGTLIQAVSPPGPAGPAIDVSVTTPAGSSPLAAADHFTYTAGGAPTVTAVSPNTGPAGTGVFISGRNLSMPSDVKFGATSTGFWFSPAPNVLTTASPLGGSGMVDVTVSTIIGTSAASASDQYTYTATPAPVVATVSPSSGPSGTPVFISGDNLNLLRPTDVVQFGGTTSPFFSPVSQGVIRANSPPAAASATPVDITVTTSGGTSATSAADLYTFTVAPAPTVTWVSPNTGPAATLVTITGTALGGATAVKFGSVTAPNPFIRSDTLIRVMSPPGSGTVDVTVTTATGTSPTSAADKYSYLLTANAWEDHGGLLTSGPAASTWGSGRLDAFVRGGDGQIWHRFLNAGTFTWEPLSGLQATSDAATVSTGIGKIDVFVRGSDSALWQKTFTSGGWGSWTRLGGLLADSPAVVSLGSGKLDVFVRGTDSKLWYDSFNGTTWTWSGAGGVLAAAPAAVSASAGTADAFLMGADSQLWRYATPSGTWTPLGGHLAVKPAATSGTSGVLDVFVEGTDLHLWHWSNPGGTGSWELIGGLLGAAPAATSWGGGRLDVMVRGTDARLYHAWSSGGSWSWEGLGGQLTGSPAVVTWGVGRLDVFVRGTDNHLWHLSSGS